MAAPFAPLDRMLTTPLDYARHLAGFDILDAALIDPRRMAFVAGLGAGRRRLVLLDASAGEGARWASVALDEGAASLAVARGADGAPAAEPVLVAQAGRVRAFALSGEAAGEVSTAAAGGGGVARLRVVQGEVWGLGAKRLVGRRGVDGAWDWHRALGAPAGRGAGWGDDVDDVDGFADGERLALVDGQLWRWDGAAWACLPLPATSPPSTHLLCAPDGQAWLAAPGGPLRHGRGARWTTLRGADPLAHLTSLAWAEGTLWGSGAFPQAGVWRVEGERLRRVPFPDALGGWPGQAWGGVLAAAGEGDDAALLAAGAFGAALLQHGAWRWVIDARALAAEAEASGALAQAEAEARAAREAAQGGARVVVPGLAAGGDEVGGTSASAIADTAPADGDATAALHAAIARFHAAAAARHAARYPDDPELRAHLDDDARLAADAPVTDADLDALAARLGRPLPPPLRAAWRRVGGLRNGRHVGERHVLALSTPAEILHALDATDRWARLASPGLVDGIRHGWGNERDELLPGEWFADAELDALNRHYLLLGRYTCGEGHEAQGWLFADAAGRVGWIWFAQDDCYWRGHEHFHTHATRLLQASTATRGLEAALAAVIGEMAGELEAEVAPPG